MIDATFRHTVSYTPSVLVVRVTNIVPSINRCVQIQHLQGIWGDIIGFEQSNKTDNVLSVNASCSRRDFFQLSTCCLDILFASRVCVSDTCACAHKLCLQQKAKLFLTTSGYHPKKCLTSSFPLLRLTRKINEKRKNPFYYHDNSTKYIAC